MKSRVSILGLMGVVAIVAFGAVALREANDLWASGVFTLTLCVFGLACLGSAFRRGNSRAFYGGFAAFGWGYMLLAFGPWSSTEVRPHMLPSWLIDNLPQPRTHLGILTCPDDDTVTPLAGNLSYTVGGFQRGNAVPLTTSASSITSRQRVGHSLFALVAALLGGLAARNFRDTGPPEAAGPPAPECAAP